jgi:hypothetical protein
VRIARWTDRKPPAVQKNQSLKRTPIRLPRCHTT